jgi:hypothetical protein
MMKERRRKEEARADYIPASLTHGPQSGSKREDIQVMSVSSLGDHFIIPSQHYQHLLPPIRLHKLMRPINNPGLPIP